MNGSTASERLIAGITYLVSFAALIPYFAGLRLVPSGPILVGGFAFILGVTLFAWKRSGFVVRHAVQAALLVLASYLTELLALLLFIVVVVLGVPFSLRDGTLLSGPLAGYNPETLIRLALAPFFLIIPWYCSYKALRGRVCEVPLIGFIARYITAKAGRNMPQ